MINDTNLAKFVNIVNSHKDSVPNDVYTYMVSFVENKIKDIIDKDCEYAVLGNININRSFIKRGIMTIPYGVSSRGITDQLKIDHFRSLDLIKGKPRSYILKNRDFNKAVFDIILNTKQISALGTAIHSVLYDTFPNLTVLVKYLKDMNRMLKKLKLATIWLSPSGLLIEQRYSPLSERELTTSILGKRKSITIKSPIKDETDLRKQNNAIVPNIVHSFDASNIALLVKGLTEEYKNINLITIHDCFATNANEVELMVLQVKLAFLSLYSQQSFVESYHQFILDYIRKTGNIIVNNLSDKNGTILSYVETPQERIKIPSVPNFSVDKDLRLNILGSQYFIN
jgi:DNA-directed RNA polymerase